MKIETWLNRNYGCCGSAELCGISEREIACLPLDNIFKYNSELIPQIRKDIQEFNNDDYGVYYSLDISRDRLHTVMKDEYPLRTPQVNPRFMRNLFRFITPRNIPGLDNRIRNVNIYLRYKIFFRDNFTCQNCGDKGQRRGGNAILHIDHIVPIFHAGSNEEYNLQTLCRLCNIKKNSNYEGINIL